MDKEMLPPKSTVELKNEMVACDLCGDNDFTFLYNSHDYLSFSPLIFELKKCEKCGLVGLNPRPENISDYYGKYRKGSIKKDIFEFLVPNRIKKIKKFKKGGRILDVGCGQGGFLNTMLKDGWEIYGVELSKDACDFARETYGLNEINNCDLLSLDFPDNFFDVITLWHVLEHLGNPKDTLKMIYKILKEDGLLLVESPNFCSIQSRFFKDKWFSLDLPRHLYQFSPKILKMYLKETNFKIIKRDYIVNPRINFISFKMSLLRWTGIQRAPKIEENDKLNTDTDSRKDKIAWKLFRFSFNIICLLISLFLNLINCDDSFRVYCKKTSRK
ncbi:MAG: class I SAM-dependent methyltransferase [Candidatus Desulfaltia sp.]|nr:class I SAM-dependent methyltransferase [Candidatus Desulfaltia sp.]